VTVDGSSMLIASFMNTARASFARDYPMIHAIETLLLHEIYLAEIHPAFWPQLEAHFGRQLAGLPRKYRLCSRGRPVIEGREPVTP
jgi:chorismate-pyruvate lyase